MQYFVDAQKQDLPSMLAPFDWEDCKAFFNREVPPLARKLIGR